MARQTLLAPTIAQQGRFLLFRTHTFLKYMGHMINNVISGLNSVNFYEILTQLSSNNYSMLCKISEEYL